MHMQAKFYLIVLFNDVTVGEKSKLMGQCLDQASSDIILIDFHTYMVYRRCIDMYHYSLVSIYIVSSAIISHGNGCIWSCNSTFYDNHFHLVLLELILYAHSQE